MFIHRAKSKKLNVKLNRHKKKFRVRNLFLNTKFMFLLATLILFGYFTIDLSLNDLIKNNGVINTEKLSFNVKKILVLNNDRVSQKEIIKLSKVKKGNVLMDYDIFEIKNNLEQHPWIKDVSVQRILPDTLKISVVENKPIAILKDSRHHYLVNECGERLEKVTDKFEIANYIELRGKNAEKKYYELIEDLYSFRSVYENIDQLEFKGQRRWNVILKNGSCIKLPEEGVKESLKFASEKQIVDELPLKKVEVDLRFTPEKFYVKLK